MARKKRAKRWPNGLITVAEAFAFINHSCSDEALEASDRRVIEYFKENPMMPLSKKATDANVRRMADRDTPPKGNPPAPSNKVDP